jgi:hypothetical protein
MCTVPDKPLFPRRVIANILAVFPKKALSAPLLKKSAG